MHITIQTVRAQHCWLDAEMKRLIFANYPAASRKNSAPDDAIFLQLFCPTLFFKRHFCRNTNLLSEISGANLRIHRTLHSSI